MGMFNSLDTEWQAYITPEELATEREQSREKIEQLQCKIQQLEYITLQQHNYQTIGDAIADGWHPGRNGVWYGEEHIEVNWYFLQRGGREAFTKYGWYQRGFKVAVLPEDCVYSFRGEHCMYTHHQVELRPKSRRLLIKYGFRQSDPYLRNDGEWCCWRTDMVIMWFTDLEAMEKLQTIRDGIEAGTIKVREEQE